MDLNIKGVDKFLVGEAKVEALRTGKTLREWVLTAIREKLNGDVTRRPKGSIRQNHSEVPADGRGASDLSAAHLNPGRLHGSGKRQGVHGVRDKVSGHREPERRSSRFDVGEVLGPREGAQPESGTVVGCAQENSGSEVVSQQYVGKYAHEPDCHCLRCQAK